MVRRGASRRSLTDGSQGLGGSAKQDYRKLEVWERAQQLAVEVDRVAAGFPPEYQHLADQMRRSAASIGANIAEGASRLTRRDFIRLLGIAQGSAGELESHLDLAQRTAVLAPDEAAPLATKPARSSGCSPR